MHNQPRHSCSLCLRPSRACICQWITPTPNHVDVVILQHPMEVHQAKGSARLLDLSLNRSRIEVGETFTQAQLQKLLAPSGDLPLHTVLLYPASASLAPPPPLETTWLTEPHLLRLVVLDGTWRKSVKMLHCNQLLQKLPRLALQQMPPSAYQIRKAHRPDQLSTLEATCHALAYLEHDLRRYQPLLESFNGFVAQQMSYRDSRQCPAPD